MTQVEEFEAFKQAVVRYFGTYDEETLTNAYVFFKGATDNPAPSSNSDLEWALAEMSKAYKRAGLV